MTLKPKLNKNHYRWLVYVNKMYSIGAFDLHKKCSEIGRGSTLLLIWSSPYVCSIDKEKKHLMTPVTTFLLV